MKTKEKKAAPPEVLEAMKTLLENGIGAHEFASLAGVAYPLPKEKVLLTTKEAAERWGLSRWTIYRWHKLGWLKAVKGAKSWMFKAEDIEGAIRRL